MGNSTSNIERLPKIYSYITIHDRAGKLPSDTSIAPDPLRGLAVLPAVTPATFLIAAFVVEMANDHIIPSSPTDARAPLGRTDIVRRSLCTTSESVHV
jgi:hypothetical protein